MFLDSLAGDAAWLARYAADRDGAPVPFSVVEQLLRAEHPYAVFQVSRVVLIVCAVRVVFLTPMCSFTHTHNHPTQKKLRAMLAVPYFEKRLYELPDDAVTPEGVAALADEVERDLQGGLSPRPLLSVPHILADEVRLFVWGRAFCACVLGWCLR